MAAIRTDRPPQWDIVKGRLPPRLEAAFLLQRSQALARVNAAAGAPVALMLVLFSVWDLYVDPHNWPDALMWRCLAGAGILLLSVLQRRLLQPVHAQQVARAGFLLAVAGLALALGTIMGGFLFGIAGLCILFCAAPALCVGRRDYLWLVAAPGSLLLFLLLRMDVERFVVVNALCALSMSLITGWLISSVLEASTRRAFAAEQALAEEARTDSLTSVSNRRALDELGLAELRRAARNGRPLAVILLDIDHFKRINDELGHPVGDAVIRAVAARLEEEVRETDHLGRWGGEEFLIILPETGCVEAQALAERLRLYLAETPLATDPPVNVTVSLGTAVVHVAGRVESDWNFLLREADAALYRAKRSGRNRVEPSPARTAVLAGEGLARRPVLCMGK